jgi:hypothetical protein
LSDACASFGLWTRSARGRATRVRAAAWLSLPLDDFLALADAHGLAAFDYDPDDFKSELASLT